MVSVGDEAPDFTVPLAGGSAYNDIEQFTQSEELGSGPNVLAFVPAAFTSDYTAEVCAFDASMDALEALDAGVYAVNVDLPFSQNVWQVQEGMRRWDF